MNAIYSQKSSTVQKAANRNAASVLDSSSQGKSLQRKADMANSAVQREERPNNTGMPDNLKSGIESLSGFSMDDVRVHYNSSKPATVQALAYTQGTDIHVAPGQEKCLPHEAWHVAQQMAGRVSPTTNINGMPVNDNAALEHEADVMGAKAVQCKNDSSRDSKHVFCQNSSVQRYVKEGDYTLSKRQGNDRKIAVKENEASTIYIKEGCSIPKDLKKLGLKKNGTENIIVDGETVTYLKIQQGRIDSVRFMEGDKKQDVLNAADKETSESLLKEQLAFVYALKFFCKDSFFGSAEKRICIKKYLEIMVDMMKNSVPLRCLGADIIDAVFAMYHIACKEQFSDTDALVLNVVMGDLKLRLSQLMNGLDVVHLKPLFRTACSDSTDDRTRLLNQIALDEQGVTLKTAAKKNHITSVFCKGEFTSLPWTGHVGSCIEQSLTDDCLYIEDAVGKSIIGKERSNAHWFAHIYGDKENSRVNDYATNEVWNFPYPIGNVFQLNNKFNSAKADDMSESIKAKKGKSWCVTFNKKIKRVFSKDCDLSLKLNIKLKNDFTFEGCFEGKNLRTKDKNYIAGVMDFMVQTANSAIDGMLVGMYADKGFVKKREEEKSVDVVSNAEAKHKYIVGENFKYGVTDDMSLLSIYKANHTSQD